MRILRIKNAKFSGDCFEMSTNINREIFKSTWVYLQWDSKWNMMFLKLSKEMGNVLSDCINPKNQVVYKSTPRFHNLLKNTNHRHILLTVTRHYDSSIFKEICKKIIQKTIFPVYSGSLKVNDRCTDTFCKKRSIF